MKYIYIDDPISSLDEHNAIVVANHLVQLFRDTPNQLKTVISTHHVLFFNVLSNEIKHLLNTRDFPQYCLSRSRKSVDYFVFRQKSDTPFFHHVAALVQLYEAAQSENIYTHHFNTLRSILEKTAVFHGYGHFSSCIKRDANDADGILHQRFVDLLSLGDWFPFVLQSLTILLAILGTLYFTKANIGGASQSVSEPSARVTGKVILLIFFATRGASSTLMRYGGPSPPSLQGVTTRSCLGTTSRAR